MLNILKKLKINNLFIGLIILNNSLSTYNNHNEVFIKTILVNGYKRYDFNPVETFSSKSNFESTPIKNTPLLALTNHPHGYNRLFLNKLNINDRGLEIDNINYFIPKSKVNNLNSNLNNLINYLNNDEEIAKSLPNKGYGKIYVTKYYDENKESFIIDSESHDSVKILPNKIQKNNLSDLFKKIQNYELECIENNKSIDNSFFENNDLIFTYGYKGQILLLSNQNEFKKPFSIENVEEFQTFKKELFNVEKNGSLKIKLTQSYIQE